MVANYTVIPLTVRGFYLFVYFYFLEEAILLCCVDSVHELVIAADDALCSEHLQTNISASQTLEERLFLSNSL